MKKLLKQGLWCLLALVMSLAMLATCREPRGLEAVQTIIFVLPLWLLSLLGAARAFLGQDWLPFARRIPFPVAKTAFVAVGILLAGAFAADAVYAARSEAPYTVRCMVEAGFQIVQYVLTLTLFYVAFLLVEQWGLRRGCAMRDIRRAQLWFTVTVLLGLLTWSLLSFAQMYHIPLNRVDNWNDEEDYVLFWFCLLCAAFLLPFWFLAARKTVRQFRGNRWLSVSDRIPKPVTGLLMAFFSALIVWQVHAARFYDADPFYHEEVPEYAHSAATGHVVQAIIWGIALFWTLVLLIKQIKRRDSQKAPNC